MFVFQWWNLGIFFCFTLFLKCLLKASSTFKRTTKNTDGKNQPRCVCDGDGVLMTHFGP